MAYILQITDLDPIEHSLIFERFLNPERVSPPDIDLDFDFDERRRGEVMAYTVDKEQALRGWEGRSVRLMQRAAWSASRTSQLG